ncbi:MAG TPA: hypothetical protein EYP19_01310 [Desulfobacterales bacterium]|nr:hypothetical protein [Desulfobacterales bacterium]
MIIYLPKMTLWKSADVTTYPRCLARGEKGAVYSHDEILELFGVSSALPQKRKHALRDVHRNIWDVEPRDNGVVLRGVCLVERSGDGFQMTARAEGLVDAYLRNRDGQQWQEQLASLLVDYDIRFRIVLYLVSSLDYRLSSHPQYRLCSADGNEEYVLFRKSEPNLNTLLNKWRGHLLGEALWQRIELLGFDRTAITKVVGLRGGQPPLETRSFSQEIKLLLALGVMKKGQRSRLFFVAERAKQVFSSQSFSELVHSGTSRPFLDVLRSTYRQLCDSEGFVIYQRLKEAVEQKGDGKNFETRLQCAVEEGRVLIARHSKGLRNDGVGFLGNPNFQRLQLAFDE